MRRSALSLTSSDRGPLTCTALMMVVLGALGGCSASQGRPTPWGWMPCYEGPQRAFPDVAVLLVDGGWSDKSAFAKIHPLSQLEIARDGQNAPLRPAELRSTHRLRMMSIDGAVVPDMREYHLPPGEHSFLAFMATTKSDPARIALVLQAGHVYKLSAELFNIQRTGSTKYTNEYIEHTVTTTANARVGFEELGAFAALTATPDVHPAVYRGGDHPRNNFGEAPPQHWGVIEGWQPEPIYQQTGFGEWTLRENGIWQPLFPEGSAPEGLELQADGTWKLPPRDKLLQWAEEYYGRHQGAP